jgi:hypothetical protein
VARPVDCGGEWWMTMEEAMNEWVDCKIKLVMDEGRCKSQDRKVNHEWKVGFSSG